MASSSAVGILAQGWSCGREARHSDGATRRATHMLTVVCAGYLEGRSRARDNDVQQRLAYDRKGSGQGAGDGSGGVGTRQTRRQKSSDTAHCAAHQQIHADMQRIHPKTTQGHKLDDAKNGGDVGAVRQHSAEIEHSASATTAAGMGFNPLRARTNPK